MNNSDEKLKEARKAFSSAAERLDQSDGEERVSTDLVEGLLDAYALIALRGALAFLNPRLSDPAAALTTWVAGALVKDAAQFFLHLSETDDLPKFMEVGIKLRQGSPPPKGSK